MKQIDDVKTDLLQDQEGYLFLKPRRGRPVTGTAQSASERQAARRDRLRASGVGYLTVELPVDVLAALDAFVQFKDLSKNDVILKLLRGQLMRKR